jgi:hypothetical protein
VDSTLRKLIEWGLRQLEHVKDPAERAKFEQFVHELEVIRDKARDLYYDRALLYPDIITLVGKALDWGLDEYDD